MTAWISARAGIAALFLSLIVGGCADDLGPPPPGFTPTDPPAGLGATYRLAVGDTIKVSVFGEASLSGPVQINAAGRAPLPLIGEIEAAGLTLDAVRRDITRRYANGYLKAPRVSVEIASYRPVYVHGAVRQGGEFTYRSGLKLRDAVAMAGGYASNANQTYVLVSRDGQDEVKVPAKGAVILLPGDNVRVPESLF